MIRIAYDTAYVLALPSGHKFPMDKYRLVPRQLLHEGLFSPEHFFAPEPMKNGEIEAVHSASYISKINTLTISDKEQRRIGFPLSNALIKREYTITYGTLQAALFARQNGVAFNIAGGTHHAFADRGEGFCIFNDIAIAASYLLNHHLAQKILVIDLDVHQGNGTASIFRHDKRVFTFSMHGKHDYPLRKEQSDLDVPLPAGTTDKHYLYHLNKNLALLLPEVKPDFIFYISGVDILASDKFGSMQLSIEGSKQRDYMVFHAARNHGIPVAVSMGGGYSKNLHDIVEAHANTYRIARFMYE